jgi:hypothetical protein
LASGGGLFIFMSGIPTGDLNPVYNVPMLGTHKRVDATLTALLFSLMAMSWGAVIVRHSFRSAEECSLAARSVGATFIFPALSLVSSTPSTGYPTGSARHRVDGVLARPSVCG